MEEKIRVALEETPHAPSNLSPTTRIKIARAWKKPIAAKPAAAAAKQAAVNMEMKVLVYRPNVSCRLKAGQQPKEEYIRLKNMAGSGIDGQDFLNNVLKVMHEGGELTHVSKESGHPFVWTAYFKNAPDVTGRGHSVSRNSFFFE